MGAWCVKVKDENPRRAGSGEEVERSPIECSLLELASLPDDADTDRHLKSQCDSGIRRDKWQINLDRCCSAYINAIFRQLFLSLPRPPSFSASPPLCIRAYSHARHENVHHDRNSQGDYLATDLIGSLQPTRECLRVLFIEISPMCYTPRSDFRA